jgi:hypothetical protein
MQHQPPHLAFTQPFTHLLAPLTNTAVHRRRAPLATQRIVHHRLKVVRLDARRPAGAPRAGADAAGVVREHAAAEVEKDAHQPHDGRVALRAAEGAVRW